MTRNAYYITTAIAYPNGEPHIGYGYELIGTDAVARWRRLEGRDVYFLTGTDEHGIKMVQTAAAEGIPTHALADRNAARFRALTGTLNISNSDFIRTTEERHFKASQEIWRRMEKSGDIYQSTYKGWYSVRDEAYFDESDLSDVAGKKLTPSGAEATWVEEPSYFFRLSAYAERLLKFYDTHPDFIAPKERRNEVMAFVKGGLDDISISRTTFDWGIPVPDAPGHVMYVWVDALTNYITGIGFPDDRSATFQKYWPADLHVIGKDIIRFHTVYWPAFLMSAGLDVPKRVFAHGFVTADGKKMSKSLGNVIDPFPLVEEFGVDPVRFFFLREVSFGQDGDYSREKFVNRNNADLANNFGNLAQRSLSMIAKNFSGRMPARTDAEVDSKIVADTIAAIARMQDAMATEQIHEAAGELVAALSAANLYFAEQAPWGLKEDLPRMGAILATTADVVRRAAIAALPFVPDSASKMLNLMAVPPEHRLLVDALAPDSGVAAGTVLPIPEPIFRKFEQSKTG